MWKSIALATLLFILCACQHVLSIPAKTKATVNGTVTKDDLSTSFAREIIRLSKRADIQAMLKPEVDPCTDFYAYACGNWHRHNPAQLLESIMTDTFQVIEKAFERRLQKALEEELPSVNLESKLQTFFRACKLAHPDDVHYKLALEKVYKEYGDLPVLVGEAWQDSDFNWWELVAKIQNKYGKQIILAVDIMTDLKQNISENKLYIGSPEYSQSVNSKIFGNIEKSQSIHDLTEYFGVEEELAKKTVGEMKALEKSLVKGGSETEDPSLKNMLILKTIEELNDEYGEHINFTKFLQLVVGEEIAANVYLYDEQYLIDTFETLQKTPKRIVANYILWQLLEEYFVDDTDDMPKWCVEKTKKYFGKYTDHMVYQRYKSDKAEAEVYELWEEIRSVYRDQLRGDKYDWISNATRTMAIEKLDAMVLEINSYDNEDFEKIYANLTIDGTNYIQNVQQILMLEQKQALNKLHGPPSTIEAPEVLSFTPAYNMLENNIRIPVAMLQPRFFWDVDYPQALKYATLGYLIAHEMIHGFDDDGRNYDKHGKDADWWDKKSMYEYNERRKCFQAQYHNYKYGDNKLPEAVLQSENIADNGGIKLAYAAYQRWLQRQHQTKPDIDQQETFKGLSLNNKQLFFTAFAQLWCEDVQTLFKSSVIESDVHAPGMFRVIGSLSNFQDFSWVFSCKQDAVMDPDYKCSIY